MKHFLLFFIVVVIGITSITAQNQTRVIDGKTYTVYTVKTTDTWQSIADEYAVSISALYVANPELKENLKGAKSILVPPSEKKAQKQATDININNTDTDSFVLPYTGDTTVRKAGEETKKIVKIERAKVYGEELRTEFRGANSLIVYRIGKNDNLKDVAKHYYCTPAEILEFNPNANPQLEVGKIIKIPVRREQVVAFEETTNAVDTTDKTSIDSTLITTTKVEEPVVVKEQVAIAEPIVIDEEEQIADEGLEPGESRLGDYIVVKKATKLYIKHRVISGEDLTRISKTNYSTNARILAVNGLTSTKVTTGQILLIPTNKEILKKLTGLTYGQKTKNTAVAKTSKIKQPKPVKEEKEDKQDKQVKVAKVKKTKNPKTGKVEQITASSEQKPYDPSFKWGDVIVPANDRLEDSARKTIADNIKDINIKEAHANASEGETKENYTHVVLKGETLESIAKKYKIAPSDIANWNNLYQERVRVGQDLIVNAKRAAKPYLALNSITPEQKTQIKQNDKSNKILAVQERGLCILTDNPIFTGILHKTAPAGTLLLVTNLDNFKKIYVRVTGTLSEKEEKDVILRIDRETADELFVNTPLTSVSITYGIVD
ncbi:MAG: LysM peptidoglycan-binding domain-containing protein [Bacteroidota bacterium]